MDKRLILACTILLISIASQSIFAFSPWNGATICTNNFQGGACLGNITYTGTTTLTSDVNASGNITLIGTLNTQGHSIAIGQVFTWNGGTINTGFGSSPAGASPGVSFPNSYGGEGGGGASGGGTNGHWCGGLTFTFSSLSCTNGLTPPAPTLSNPVIQNFILQGVQLYLESAGGGNAQACNIYPLAGQPAYGLYLQARTIVVGSNGGTLNAAGQTGGFEYCFDGQGIAAHANTGGSGGAAVIIATNGIPQDPSYSIAGGSGISDGGQSSYSGGNGQVTKYRYTTPPVPTPFIVPQIKSIIPNNVLAVSSISFTINVIQTTNPIKNVTILWGDSSSNIITSGSTNDVITHTYPYGGNSFAYTARIYVCDINSECNYSFSQVINTHYTTPSFNSITPRTVLEGNAVIYTINVIKGNFTIKNTTVQFGDGSFNVITSNALSVNTIHTYAYVHDGKPDTFMANIIVCDINSICSTTPANILGVYTTPQINNVSHSAIYTSLSSSFTFNIIKGNYSVTSLQVNWGDNTSNFISVNAPTPSLAHTYLRSGNYILQAIAIDQNGAPSNTFTSNVFVNQYILPMISTITPTSVYSANSIEFNFTDKKGSFNITSVNSIVINFGDENTIYISNSVPGVHQVAFTYPNNGNYSVSETITDTNGFQGTNITLINVGAFPWSFTTPTPTIYYNVTNVTTQRVVQTNQTDNLPITYSVEKQTIANDYICSVSISNSGLFSISCITNPNVFSYANQTLVVAIYAQDTHGSTKQVLETIYLTPKSPPPIIPATPFSTNTLAKPLNTPPFTPFNAPLVTIILAAGVILVVSLLYISRGGKEN